MRKGVFMKHASSVSILETTVSFGSVCSGIEAASVAWEPLGFKASWFSEIEPFPCAVLKHHWPEVINLGDMTKIRDRIAEGEVYAPDVLVGGTPCQAFSVAGARKSLDDDRGQLTLEYVRLLNEIDTARSIRGDSSAIAVWENVHGVLSTKDNAFGCFLGALAGEDCELKPSGKKWTNAGCVFGPQRTVAWRVLDAQYFGLPQRRRRVFVISSARKDINPVEILFEFDGVRRDSAPSRSTGQDVAENTDSGFAESSFAQFRSVSGDGGTLKRSGGVAGGRSESLIVKTVSGKDIFTPLQASDGSKIWINNQSAFSGDYFINQPKNETMHVVHGSQDPITQDNTAFPIGRNHGQENAILFEPRSADGVPRIASDQTLCPTLNRMGGGQREPCIAYGIPGNWIGRKPENGGNAVEPMHDIAPCQTKTDRHAVAYAVSENQRAECRLTDYVRSVTCSGGKPGQGYPAALQFGLVRRLTPVECEFLQGFPRNHTQIPYRGKPAEKCPDGPRYSACGNSMAVPVMRWIGKRILNAIKQAQI